MSPCEAELEVTRRDLTPVLWGVPKKECLGDEAPRAQVWASQRKTVFSLQGQKYGVVGF